MIMYKTNESFACVSQKDPKPKIKKPLKFLFGSLRKFQFFGAGLRQEMQIRRKAVVKSPVRICWACLKVSSCPECQSFCCCQDMHCNQLSQIGLIWFLVQAHFRGPTEVPRNSFTGIHLLVLLKRNLHSLQILCLLPATATPCSHQALI